MSTQRKLLLLEEKELDFKLPTKCKVAPDDKSSLALDFKADIIVGAALRTSSLQLTIKAKCSPHEFNPRSFW